MYQYQTHNCCFNLFDPSKTSSTVTTAASNENFSSFHTQSIGNSCQTADFIQSRNTQNFDDEKSKTAASSKFNENHSRLTSSGSEFPSTIFNNQSRVNFDLSVDDETPSYDENTSKAPTAEKVIEIELSNENYKKSESDQDDCSCTKKYLPYKVNEKNVWQVYETSDCKYIQSKFEIDEIFEPPASSNGTNPSTSEYNPLLHSRSNFSNQIICHAINHDTRQGNVSRETEKSDSVNSSTPRNVNSTSDSVYTPTFNIKTEAVVETCQCIDEETEDNESKLDETEERPKENVASQPVPTPSPPREAFTVNQKSGKLLNRPKATNNISRDQVKPVDKEIQNEITRSGVKMSSMKAAKPIRLPSPVAKHQSSPPRSGVYESDSESTESEFSSIETQLETIKEKKKSPKMKSNQNSPKEKSNSRERSSLVRQESLNQRQENKSVVIPNIHQGKRNFLSTFKFDSSVISRLTSNRLVSDCKCFDFS